MQLLPTQRRTALYAVYAFGRQVDDIADGQDAADIKLAGLTAWRNEIRQLFAGDPRHPITRVLASAVTEYDLRESDFDAVVDGMEMDVRGLLCAPSMQDLDLYLERAAGGIARLAIKIFGAPGNEGRELALYEARALQLTNVLRDLKEDEGLGRLYLPRELLLKSGIRSLSPDEVLRHPRLPDVCADMLTIARRDYAQATRLAAELDPRCVWPARLMLETYRIVLNALEVRGWDDLDTRAQPDRRALIMAMLRHTPPHALLRTWGRAVCQRLLSHARYALSA